MAALAGADPATVTFVSGGTEAIALAMESAVAAGHRRLLIGATEHEAVRETAAALAARHADVTVEIWPGGWLRRRRSRLAGGALLRPLSKPGPNRALVCLMLATINETGVIQLRAAAWPPPWSDAAGGWLHVDAVQAAGKMPPGFSTPSVRRHACLSRPTSWAARRGWAPFGSPGRARC